ncbi:hypothetical protein MRX96_013055 [Rhipicephalus microplus]
MKNRVGLRNHISSRYAGFFARRRVPAGSAPLRRRIAARRTWRKEYATSDHPALHDHVVLLNLLLSTALLLSTSARRRSVSSSLGESKRESPASRPASRLLQPAYLLHWRSRVRLPRTVGRRVGGFALAFFAV